MVGPRPWGTALWITVSPVPGKYAFALPVLEPNAASRDYLAGYGGLAARQTPQAACPRPQGHDRLPPGLLVLVKPVYKLCYRYSFECTSTQYSKFSTGTI